MKASIVDANTYITQEDAMQYITSEVIYTPINMDKEQGLLKKRAYAEDIINNDIFPHCKIWNKKLGSFGLYDKSVGSVSFGFKQMIVIHISIND